MVWMRNKPRMTSEFQMGSEWIKIVTSDNGSKERIRIAGLELTLRNLEKWLKKWEYQERWRKRSVKFYLVYFQGKK